MRRVILSACLLNTAVPVVLANDIGEAKPIELDAVSVYGDAERADGPVIGYRATRSLSATRTDTPTSENTVSGSKK